MFSMRQNVGQASVANPRMRSMFRPQHLTATLFLVSVMTFPRSFISLKLVCLGLLVLTGVTKAVVGRPVKIYPSIVLFYCWVSIVGILWSFIGMLNGGELMGLIDNVRLYVGWSMAYIVILTLLRANDGVESIHAAIVYSGLLIVAVNFAGLLDTLFAMGLVDGSLRDELELFVGFHDGYVQIMSHNIGSLFFIVPYLLALQFRTDVVRLNSTLAKLSLFASLVLVVVSGRRALWLSVVLTPAIIWTLALLTGSWPVLARVGRRLAITAAAAAPGALLIGLLGYAALTELSVLDYLRSAFSAEDERTIQLQYLVRSFIEHPVIGSGFGVNAGYVRNQERPWIYELTYFQILFNFGIIGSMLVLAVAVAYFHMAASVVAQKLQNSGQAFCMIVGLLVFLIGSYSNPYLGSFDFLLYLAMLPYLSTYFIRGPMPTVP
jgi:hypothetical protein